MYYIVDVKLTKTKSYICACCNYTLSLQYGRMAQRKTKTISIPPDLDKQLDRFPEENWSAIACEAFRIRLIQLEAMKNIGGTEAAVARLRASRERSTNEMFAAGEIAGAVQGQVWLRLGPSR